MRHPLKTSPKKFHGKSFVRLLLPVQNCLDQLTPLESRGNRPLQMTFEDQLNILVYYHLEEFDSGRHLLQSLKEDDFAREYIAPAEGIEKSAFFEAVNSRGLEQLTRLFELLQRDARLKIPKRYTHLGHLVSIDGSLIDAVLSMIWADYRTGSKKAKTHLGFDINRGIPQKFFVTEGKADERPFVSLILEPGQTGVMDRYYQCHKNFDDWQTEKKHFVCRIKANTIKTVLVENPIDPDSIIFYDALVKLGTPGINQTQTPIRVVGYEVEGIPYWVATDRHDLKAEDMALIYKLRWEVESFFAWWKKHLKVYHILARSQYGLMVQIFAGLITYLLLAIYCQEQHGEQVNIKRVRELRFNIKNEFAEAQKCQSPAISTHKRKQQISSAIT